MTIVIRTFRSRRTQQVTRREWWIMSDAGFPLEAGTGRTRRECFAKARHRADQIKAEFADYIANPLT